MLLSYEITSFFWQSALGSACADASWAVILSSFRPAGGCRAVTSDSAILPVCAGKAGTWSISTHPIILSVCPPHYHHFSGPLRAALSVRKSGDYTERCLIFQQDRFPFRCSVMDTRKQFCSVVQESGILNSASFFLMIIYFQFLLILPIKHYRVCAHCDVSLI